MPTASDVLAVMQERAGAARDAGNYGPVVLLDQDPVLVRLTACWRNVPVSTLPAPDTEIPAGLPESSWLRWYWSMLEPDPLPVWIRIAGLPDAAHVRRACLMAIDNRVVCPDGTVSQWAEQYLSRLVAQRMTGQRR